MTTPCHAETNACLQGVQQPLVINTASAVACGKRCLQHAHQPFVKAPWHSGCVQSAWQWLNAGCLQPAAASCRKWWLAGASLYIQGYASDHAMQPARLVHVLAGGPGVDVDNAGVPPCRLDDAGLKTRLSIASIVPSCFCCLFIFIDIYSLRIGTHVRKP